MRLLIRTMIQAFYLLSSSSLPRYHVHSTKQKSAAGILEFNRGFPGAKYHCFMETSFASIPKASFVTVKNYICTTW